MFVVILKIRLYINKNNIEQTECITLYEIGLSCHSTHIDPANLDVSKMAQCGMPHGILVCCLD